MISEYFTRYKIASRLWQMDPERAEALYNIIKINRRI